MRRRDFVSTIGAVLTVPQVCAAAPECSPSAGGLTARDYRAYLAAFNRHDFAEFGRYYTENVIFEGRGGNFRGRDQVLDFYRGVQARLRESLSLLDLIVGPRGIVADVLTTLNVLQDWPDFPAGPMRRGQTVRSQNFIWYEVADGRFTHIRSAHYRYL